MVQAGATSACFDADFLPFGREKDATTTCNVNNYKFEGKERDTETGNDDFGARYYSSNFGRWESPDWSSIPDPVPYANLTNPQTLNLYAMVGDNPESFADLDGHTDCDGTEITKSCDKAAESEAMAKQAAADANRYKPAQKTASLTTIENGGYVDSNGNFHSGMTVTTTTMTTTCELNCSYVRTNTTTTTASFSNYPGQEGKFLGGWASL